MRRVVVSILVFVVVPAVFAGPVSILTEPTTIEVTPGSALNFLFLIRETAPAPTPVFGYSLDIDVTPGFEASGAVTANIDLTNFFDSQNLITAGGATRDAPASQIVGAGGGGVFISTNTDDLSAIAPVLGVNDVLAQVFFDVSPDALGTFTVELGPSSVLGDAMGQAVAFDFSPSSITVIPEPSTLILLSLGLGAAVLRRRSKRC